MERKSNSVCAGLFAAYAVLPALRLILRLFGITMTFRPAFVFGGLLLAVTAAAAVLLKKLDENAERENRGFLYHLPFLTAVIWLILFIRNEEDGDLKRLDLFLLSCEMVACFVTCVWLRARYILSRGAKITFCVLPSVIFSRLAAIMLLGSILGGISGRTVVKEELSPNAEYVARVIDCDEGGTGGETLVAVRKNGELDLYIIKFEHAEKTVYLGDWGEYKSMRLSWKDNGMLMINGNEYPIG